MQTSKCRKLVNQQVVIYHSSELTDFQKKVNAAAAEIAQQDPRLVHKGNRGLLLDKAREHVSNQGYVFKKGKSCSKRLKVFETIRTQRISDLRDKIEGIDNHMRIKGQSEANQKL